MTEMLWTFTMFTEPHQIRWVNGEISSDIDFLSQELKRVLSTEFVFPPPIPRSVHPSYGDAKSAWATVWEVITKNKSFISDVVWPEDPAGPFLDLGGVDGGPVDSVKGQAEFGGPGSGPRNREGGIGRLERERVASESLPAAKWSEFQAKYGGLQDYSSVTSKDEIGSSSGVNVMSGVLPDGQKVTVRLGGSADVEKTYRGANPVLEVKRDYAINMLAAELGISGPQAVLLPNNDELLSWVPGETFYELHAAAEDEDERDNLLLMLQEGDTARMIAMMDYVTGQQDRHGGNVLVDSEHSRKPAIIDSGMAFDTMFDPFGVPETQSRVDNSIYSVFFPAIQGENSISDDDMSRLRGGLEKVAPVWLEQGLVSSDELAAVQSRVEVLDRNRRFVNESDRFLFE